MKPLQTALIGCGHFAKRHAAILASLSEVRLVGFCDSQIERAAAYNQQYAGGEAGVFSDYHTLFTSADLDLIYICLPPYAHSGEVELACRHRVHFLIEKPIALSADLALAMAGQVRSSGVKSQVGFMYRFGEAALRLKEYIQDSGSAFMVGRYACNSLHSWWWREREKSGGQLVEQVIHILDMARFFLGEPSQVFSMQANLFHRDVDQYTGEDASATAVRFHSGAMAAIAATNGAIPNRWEYDWRVFLPGLTADFTDANHAVFHDTRQVPAAPGASLSIASDTDMYLAETLDLIQAIRDDRPPRVPIEEGVRSLVFALAATQSAQQNAPVDVEMPI